MVGRNVDRITVDICIQQLGRLEEIIWLPYDVGLSAAAETLVKHLKEWLSVPPFTRAFLKSPSSRGLSAIAELLVKNAVIVRKCRCCCVCKWSSNENVSCHPWIVCTLHRLNVSSRQQHRYYQPDCEVLLFIGPCPVVWNNLSSAIYNTVGS